MKLESKSLKQGQFSLPSPRLYIYKYIYTKKGKKKIPQSYPPSPLPATHMQKRNNLWILQMRNYHS